MTQDSLSTFAYSDQPHFARATKQDKCVDTTLDLRRGHVPGTIRLYEYEAIEEILDCEIFSFFPGAGWHDKRKV